MCGRENYLPFASGVKFLDLEGQSSQGCGSGVPRNIARQGTHIPAPMCGREVFAECFTQFSQLLPHPSCCLRFAECPY